MDLFSYKITRDYGFAPNPFGGFCTLATCKPRIRSAATIGDLVVGCGSSANDLVERIIYVMRVSGKCTFEGYWKDSRFRNKRPVFKSSLARAYGDNIYHKDSKGSWIQERSHHSFADGGKNELNLEQDTSSDNVLWSDDFVYFGQTAPPIPKSLCSSSAESLYPGDKCRDYRRNFSSEFIAKVDAWYRAYPRRGYLGRPVEWP